MRRRVVAIISRGNDVLLSFAIDPDTGARYGRFLGGGVEPGERDEDAVRRELREELGVEVGDLRLLGVVENVFSPRTIHEEVVVFAAAFADTALYERESFEVQEAVCDGPARWVAVDRLRRGEIAVYPPALVALLPSSAPL